ncbi:Replicative DNA helicase [Prosthecobacter debontii]|uniref:DNA 5'-3' helicase n=2 Tax=Prosthecobacter debontii TaxID=48467 RepID=A0A1T4XIM1_9BACT|nr:Replicative DNA helicase [Prosthecobacter debontii]
MPNSQEAEEGLLSCIFQDPDRIMEARAKLQPEAFYHCETRTIFEELLTMDQEGIPLESVALNIRLNDQGKIERGLVRQGQATIIACSLVIPAYFDRYLKMIHDRWTLRKGIHGHLLAVRLMFRHLTDRMESEVAGTLTDCQNIVQMSLDGVKFDTGSSATLRECLSEHIDHMMELQQKKDAGIETLIPTGFPTLDRRAGGIGLNEYWLVTGPTKSGKSVLAGQIVKHAARRGFKAKIYTNEVQRVSYAGRFLASESSEFDGTVERHGFVNRKQQNEYSRAITALKNSIGDFIIIDNAAGKYVEDVVADMRLEARSGTVLFVVDLIGKLRTRASHGNRERELAHISGCLSDATKTLGIACLVVAQENEDGAVRESKALGMDCEAWLKLVHVRAEKRRGTVKFGSSSSEMDTQDEIIRNRRKLIVQLARGFAAGDVIDCAFDGARFFIAELDNHRTEES